MEIVIKISFGMYCEGFGKCVFEVMNFNEFYFVLSSSSWRILDFCVNLCCGYSTA